MAINLDVLVIDHALRGTLFDKSTSDVIFSANKVQNPSLEINGEQVFATDNLGYRVATFDRNQTCTFSAENALLSLGIMAAQFGASKEVASSSSKIVTPKMEIITVGGAPNTTITLAETPYGTTPVPFIYKINSDQSMGTKYAVAASASATEFAISTNTITLPTGSLATDRFAIFYSYEAESAVKISKLAANTALAGKFDLEVMFVDPCNQSTKYYGHIIFPNVKMNPSFTLNFATDGVHSFGFEAMQDYCSTSNEFFYIVVPE
jgi:hypothetical protein